MPPPSVPPPLWGMEGRGVKNINSYKIITNGRVRLISFVFMARMAEKIEIINYKRKLPFFSFLFSLFCFLHYSCLYINGQRKDIKESCKGGKSLDNVGNRLGL